MELREETKSGEIRVSESGLISVPVIGEMNVRDPGTYTLRRNVTTLLDILSLAGGPDDRAGQVAYVIRNIRPQQAAHGSGQEQQGAEAGSLPGTSVLEGIAMARGVMEEEASSSKSMLKRKTVDGEIIIPLDIPAITKGEKPNPYLQADDVIVVPQTGLRRSVLYVYSTIRSLFNFGVSGRAF
jgi:protein involved in polysaccharide export with SLBB domain